MGQYLYERFSAANVEAYLKAYLRSRPGWAIADLGKPNLPPASEAPYAAATASNMKLTVRRGDVSVRAVMQAGPAGDMSHGVKLTVTLYRHLPFAEIALAIEGKQADPWPEAGWLCLPFNVPKPEFRMASVGGIVDPARDVIRSANHDTYCLSGGVAVVGANGAGAAFCSADCPLVSLDRPGSWRYSREFIPAKPAAFVNLYNNQISTNFQQWIAGSWTSHVRVWAVEKYDAATHLIGPSAETRSPLLAAAFDGPAGTLPTTRAGLELSRRGVLVTAFGANPDGAGLVLRLWEHAGRDAPCTVRLPAGLDARQVQPCDLRGRAAGRPIPVRDGRFQIPIKHCAPASVLIDAGAPPPKAEPAR